MPVTLKDIASRCGLAVSTVSNILNNNKDSYASGQVKELVKNTARELGYRKHYLSVSLRTRRTQSIGLCLDYFVDETRRFFMNSFVELFNEAGYEVAIRAHHRDPAQALASLQFFTERCKDGIVLFTDFLRDIGPMQQEISDAIAQCPCKILGVGSQFRGVLPSLDVDRAVAFENAFERFDKQGHTRILVVYKTPEEFRLFWPRLDQSRYVHMENVFTFEDFASRWQTIRATHPDITAVFFRTDAIAIPALKFFAIQGIRVPQDLAVCSFDHYDFSDQTTPALTTYDINFTQLGSLAFSHLHEWMTGTRELAPDYFYTIQPRFIARQSHCNQTQARSAS